jgi:hypothetical protein
VRDTTQGPQVHGPADAGAGDGRCARRAQHRRCAANRRSPRRCCAAGDQALEAAQERLAGGQERSRASEQRRRIAELERALGRTTYEAEILGNGFRVWE